jgi:hypothetical protein
MGTRHVFRPVSLLMILIAMALVLSSAPAQAQATASVFASAETPGGGTLPSTVGAALPTGHAVHIPETYVLRLITCDTAVYETAGGAAIPGLLVKAGQTWFVNPKPKKVSGEKWTRIYLGGPHTAWIPSQCVAEVP